MRNLVVVLLSIVFTMQMPASDIYTPGKKTGKTFKDFSKPFLEKYCINCHDNDTEKGSFSLEDLGPVNEANAAIWKSIWEQVSLNEMPPKKKKQPQSAEKLFFVDWIVEELSREMEDKGGFDAHLDPVKGNHLNHDLLFGSIPENIKLIPTSSPARLWRVTPEEHITRLSILVNGEQKYDPAKPGLRTYGDALPIDHSGNLKIYLVDRVTNYHGDFSGYERAIKSLPGVLAWERKYGLDNYPHLHSVNSAEINQILGMTNHILEYMAFGPLKFAESNQITDDKEYIKNFIKRKPAPKGGPLVTINGSPKSLIYTPKILRPLTPVYELIKEDGLSEKHLRASVNFLFETLSLRPPKQEECDKYIEIVKKSVAQLGKEKGIYVGLSPIFVHREALFRQELAENGKPDAYGRVMLQDWELGLAVNHAFAYLKPDEKLKKAIQTGKMKTKEDVKREVERILTDDSIRKPRILQFFRDYFDYDLGGGICKDSEVIRSSLLQFKISEGGYYRGLRAAETNTERLIELILKEDKNVLKEILTTQKVVAGPLDSKFFGRFGAQDSDIAQQKKEAAAEAIRIKKQIAEVEAKVKANPKDAKQKRNLEKLKKKLANGSKKYAEEFFPAKFDGNTIYVRAGRRSLGDLSLKNTAKLALVTEGERLGILTHPTWLVSHSDNMENHAIHRGIWIRKKLLGGGIPDVPITVDAMLPEDDTKTLRERMQVTKEKYCWQCHDKVDPIGLAFEMYNHTGQYRLKDKGKPVDSSGEIIDSGDPNLDGKYKDAIEMIKKLSESERVEQVFVRHVFRFWMGRNETLNDRPVLIAAHEAYKESGGSMKALLLSLLTSDAFLYRKVK